MEIVKNLRDDEMLVQACKKLCNDFVFTFSPSTITMNGETVLFYHEDFERLVELAEIGKNVIRGNYGEVVENKREEDVKHSEKQPEPHFKRNNEECSFDCSKCLCETCVTSTEVQGAACSESCCNITCHKNYYVDSCPAYNDGHNL